MGNLEDLAKLDCINALFRPELGFESFHRSQIKTAIDWTLTGDSRTSAPFEPFARAALELLQQQSPFPVSYGFCELNLSDEPYHPLWIREKLILSLKKIAGYEYATLLIKGLRDSIKKDGTYWTRQKQQAYDDTLAYITQIAAQWTTARTRINIVCL